MSDGKAVVCAACGEPAACDSNGTPFNTIHRDGFLAGPEVPLCGACASADGPSCEEIWERLARRRAGDAA